MNLKLIGFSLGVVFTAFLSGCATQPSCCTTTTQTTCTVNTCQTSAALQATTQGPTKLLAVGYGAVGSYSQYTHAQQKLMAMRAAQVDAYRNLAEQVYGFRVWGNTAVSAFATQNDSVRSYVDAFVRGARVVNMTSIADGNWEATVELELSPAFLDCLTRGGNCGIRNSVPACVHGGCTQPSVSYISAY